MAAFQLWLIDQSSVLQSLQGIIPAHKLINHDHIALALVILDRTLEERRLEVDQLEEGKHELCVQTALGFDNLAVANTCHVVCFIGDRVFFNEIGRANVAVNILAAHFDPVTVRIKTRKNSKSWIVTGIITDIVTCGNKNRGWCGEFVREIAEPSRTRDSACGSESRA